jgi:hypothetical protein
LSVELAAQGIADIEGSTAIDSTRRCLRILNGSSSPHEYGITYLRDIFGQFLKLIDIDMETWVALKKAPLGFFEKAENHLSNSDGPLPRA